MELSTAKSLTFDVTSIGESTLGGGYDFFTLSINVNGGGDTGLIEPEFDEELLLDLLRAARAVLQNIMPGPYNVGESFTIKQNWPCSEDGIENELDES